MTRTNPPTSMWSQVILNNRLINVLAFTWPHSVPSLSALDSNTPAESLRLEPTVVLDSFLTIVATHSFHMCERNLGAGLFSTLPLRFLPCGIFSWPVRKRSSPVSDFSTTTLSPRALRVFGLLPESVFFLTPPILSSLCQVIFGLSPQPSQSPKWWWWLSVSLPSRLWAPRGQVAGQSFSPQSIPSNQHKVQYCWPSLSERMNAQETLQEAAPRSPWAAATSQDQ